MDKSNKKDSSLSSPEQSLAPAFENSRRAACRRVLRDCFWNDYQLSEEVILQGLDARNTYFMRFLFSKIIENSPHASREIRILFPRAEWEKLLARYMKQAGHKKRIRVVAANLTRNYDLVPELQWKQ